MPHHRRADIQHARYPFGALALAGSPDRASRRQAREYPRISANVLFDHGMRPLLTDIGIAIHASSSTELFYEVVAAWASQVATWTPQHVGELSHCTRNV